MDIKERRFESDIESYLITKGGYEKGDLKTYDREKAIDLPKLVEYIKKTQPNEWKRYEFNYGSDAENKLYKRFQEEVNKTGLLYVLRHGFSDRGANIKVATFKENTTLNKTVIEHYNANILTCTRQFKYSTENENSIDIALSLNGIPIVAIELKDQLTGQSIENAKLQYIKDRNPKEFCFHFDNRFLVYFAVDLNVVEMTTKLAGDNTYFLPFNMGSNGPGVVGGAGNPENPYGYPTSYLWEKVLSKDSLMNLLQWFFQRVIEEKVEYKKGKEVRKKSIKLIFPRYHQLDVVTQLVDDVRTNGSGKNYLIQHSAGSGKSNSIAWLAYRLSELHDKNNKPIFTSVIIINDRTVLDRQTQNTVYGFDHVAGIVEKIDDNKHSADLRNAINAGKKIIITTLQKFPYIYNEIDDTTDRRFAIIVDEAHNSQSGKSALKLKAALADTEDALREYAELEGKAEEEVLDTEDQLVQEMLKHGKHKNLSFFAFTATPKEKTIEAFGWKRSDGSFAPHHVYSMKQAIDEGFILDVLKNFTYYKTCYRIVKETAENPELPVNAAAKAILRYKDLHPHNISQKSAIIVETYRNVTRHKINGQAKAMVVTASRLHAVRYYHEIKKYIETKGYNDLEILVAFSGIVKDKGVEYSEEKINLRPDGTAIKESQLPSEFNRDEYAMLIVAEKYQTGFDQPLLHTMFVDKKLKDVKAVQTLSRLNRICPGKTDTFVLDFVNTPEEIKKAFELYYEDTSLDEEINVNLIYDAKKKLREKAIYTEEDIKSFLKVFLKKSKQTDTDLGKMISITKPVVEAYKGMKEQDRFEFKKTIKNFNKWYTYITQISRIFDKSLQEEYYFTQYLEKLLPPAYDTKTVNLEDKLKLDYYKLVEEFRGEISLKPTSEDKVLVNPKSLDGNVIGPEKDDFLESIINKINDRFGGIFTDGDRVIVETLVGRSKENAKLMKQALKNDEEVFIKSIFPEAFNQVAQDCYMESMKSFSKLFENKNFYETVMNVIAKETYDASNRVSMNKEK